MPCARTFQCTLFVHPCWTSAPTRQSERYVHKLRGTASQPPWPDAPDYISKRRARVPASPLLAQVHLLGHLEAGVQQRIQDARHREHTTNDGAAGGQELVPAAKKRRCNKGSGVLMRIPYMVTGMRVCTTVRLGGGLHVRRECSRGCCAGMDYRAVVHASAELTPTMGATSPAPGSGWGTGRT